MNNKGECGDCWCKSVYGQTDAWRCPSYKRTGFYWKEVASSFGFFKELCWCRDQYYKTE